jgi:hypothetical protein
MTDGPDAKTPLMLAACASLTNHIKVLLSISNIDVNKKDRTGI